MVINLKNKFRRKINRIDMFFLKMSSFWVTLDSFENRENKTSVKLLFISDYIPFKILVINGNKG